MILISMRIRNIYCRLLININRGRFGPYRASSIVQPEVLISITR